MFFEEVIEFMKVFFVIKDDDMGCGFFWWWFFYVEMVVYCIGVILKVGVFVDCFVYFFWYELKFGIVFIGFLFIESDFCVRVNEYVFNFRYGVCLVVGIGG